MKIPEPFWKVPGFLAWQCLRRRPDYDEAQNRVWLACESAISKAQAYYLEDYPPQEVESVAQWSSRIYDAHNPFTTYFGFWSASVEQEALLDDFRGRFIIPFPVPPRVTFPHPAILETLASRDAVRVLGNDIQEQGNDFLVRYRKPSSPMLWSTAVVAIDLSRPTSELLSALRSHVNLLKGVRRRARLDKSVRRRREKYADYFEAYELKNQGETYDDIARVLWPEAYKQAQPRPRRTDEALKGKEREKYVARIDALRDQCMTYAQAERVANSEWGINAPVPRDLTALRKKAYDYTVRARELIDSYPNLPR